MSTRSGLQWRRIVCIQVFSTHERCEQEMCQPIVEGGLSGARWCRADADTVEYAMDVVWSGEQCSGLEVDE